MGFKPFYNFKRPIFDISLSALKLKVTTGGVHITRSRAFVVHLFGESKIALVALQADRFAVFRIK